MTTTIHPDSTPISSRCMKGIYDTKTIPLLLQTLKTQNPSYCVSGNEVQNLQLCQSMVSLNPDIASYNDKLNLNTLYSLKIYIEPQYHELIDYCERVLESEKEGALQLLKKRPEDYNEERKVYLERASYAKSWNWWIILIQLMFIILIIITIGFIQFKGGKIDYSRILIALGIPLIIFLYGWFFISGYTIS
jgi:hypothetical protein